MDAQATSSLLGIIIQGNIVILTVTGTFVTFAIAFTWQHAAKARELVLQRDRLRKEGASGLKPLLEECYGRFKDVYESWLLDAENVSKFFDNLAFRHPRTSIYRNFLAVASLLFLPMKAYFTDPNKRYENPKLKMLAKSAVHAATALGILHIARLADTVLWRGNREPYVPFLSPLFFLLAPIRSSRAIGDFQEKTSLAPTQVIKEGVQKMLGKKTRKEVVEWSVLLIQRGKELVLGKEIREELTEWGALHELATMFPKELLFPIRLAIPPTARRLGFNYVKNYPHEDRVAFEATKHSSLPNEYLERIANIKRNYDKQCSDLGRCADQIKEVNDEISRFFYFLRPEGKKRTKGIIMGLVAFSIVNILWGLLVMSASAIDFARSFGLTVSLALFIIVLVFLVALIVVFVRSL